MLNVVIDGQSLEVLAIYGREGGKREDVTFTNPSLTGLSDEECGFIAAYLTLLPEDAGQRTSACAKCSTVRTGRCALAHDT